MPHTVSILTTYFVNINPRRRCNIYFLNSALSTHTIFNPLPKTDALPNKSSHKYWDLNGLFLLLVLFVYSSFSPETDLYVYPLIKMKHGIFLHAQTSCQHPNYEDK